MKAIPALSSLPPELAFMAGRGYTKMILRDVITEIRLGVHPWERHSEHPQRVVVNVEMFADVAKADGELSSVIDYDPIRAALRRWPARPHVDLIETLLEELVALCFADARVKACRVSILKPDIFPEAAGAGVETFRIREA